MNREKKHTNTQQRWERAHKTMESNGWGQIAPDTATACENEKEKGGIEWQLANQ